MGPCQIYVSSTRPYESLQKCSERASGLDPRVNRVRSLPQSTELAGTVATWIEDRNPTHLPAVAEECDTLNTHARGVVRRVLSGGVEPPILTDTGRSGITSNYLISGRSRESTCTCDDRPILGRAVNTEKPRGLSPRYFTYHVAVPGRDSDDVGSQSHN